MIRSKGDSMPKAFELSPAAREQAWEQACEDGDYDLARQIAQPRLSDLSLEDQIEAIKVSSSQGFLLRSDAMRILGELNTQVLEGGTPLDQSIFTTIDFLNDLVDPQVESSND
jgi:hypothetical protein